MSIIKQFASTFLLTAVVVSTLRADDPAETTDPPAEASEAMRSPALVVYQRLIEEYQAGESNGLPALELLRTWSIRVAGEPIESLSNPFPPSAASVAETRKTIITSMQSHTKRMNDLSKIVHDLQRAGKASEIDVAAVEYYIAEAERLPQAFESLSRFLELTAESEVILPEAVVELPLLPTKIIVVQVDAEGVIQMEGKPLTLDQFDELLRSEKPENGEISVVLRCDREAKLRDLLTILDIAKEHTTSYSISTAEEPDSEEDE